MKNSLFLLPLLGMTVTAAEVEMKPTKVALFNNGYSFITMGGTLGDDTSSRLAPLPVPAAGSFWLAAEQGVDVTRLVSGMLDYLEPQTPDTMPIMVANEGAQASITYRTTDKQVITAEGKILPFARQAEPLNSNTISGEFRPGTQPVTGGLIFLQGEKGTIAIPVHNVITFSIAGEMKMPTQVVRRPGVELKIGSPAPGKKIEASCLSSGLSWTPSYRLALGKDGKALFTTKATVTNTLIKLENVELELITGFPSLENAGTIDPMALRQMAQVAMAPRAMKASRNVQMEMACDSYAESAPAMGMAGGAFAGGVSTSGLFFYPVANFTAQPGEVITQPLFNTELSYKPIYRWSVEDPAHFPSYNPLLPPSTTEVWYGVRFTNPLEMPLATAPVELMEEGRIAGSTTLQHTAAKGECTINISRAAKVATTKKSTLKEQKEVTLPPLNSPAMRATSEVELTVNNTSDEDIDVEINQQVQGNVIEDSINKDGKCITSDRRYASYGNTDNTIRWSFTLKPGETETLKFTYERYTALPQKQR